MTDLRVGYVLLRFPQLTETFVAEEIRHVEAKGIGVQLFSILHSKDKLIHPVSQELLPQVKYMPGIGTLSLWRAQVHFLLKEPRKYLGLLEALCRERYPRLSFLPKRIYLFLKSVWLAWRLEQEPVDLVHIHFAWLPAIAGIVVKRLLGVPFTFTAHAYDIYSNRNDLLPMAAREAEQIVTISEVNKGTILGMVPELTPAKVEVIRCGIDLERFRPDSGGPVNRTLQLTSVGSLLHKKGHEYLIRACGELHARGLDFQCMIVGQGEMERVLQDQIAELGLQRKVLLVGSQSQDWVRGRLQSSDVFVLACVASETASGDRDGIPVAIMEAMAMAVPVISTPVSGIPELVRHEETGLLVPERDAHELARAITRLAEDVGLRSRLATSARSLVRDQHDIVKNTRRLQTLFEQSARASRAETGLQA